MKSLTKKAALGVGVVLVAIVAAALFTACQAQSADSGDGSSASLEASDLAFSESDMSESSDNQVEEDWPGQSLGYIGPNGEGIPKPEDFETAEEYQYAIVETSEVEWSWDDYPYIVNEDGVKYRDGAVEVDMYRSYGEARCHEVIEEMGGLWLDDVFAWDAGLDTATVYVGFPRGTDVFKVAEELEALPEVDHANPFIYTRIDLTTGLDTEALGANDIQAGSQTYLQVSHFIGAWLNSTGDRELTVAVIDAGIDLDHPDLAANIDYLRAYNAAGDTPLIPFGTDPDDYGLVDSERENHGSGVSGVVSAVTNNAIGISGASYNAYVLPICAFGLSSDDNGAGIQWEYVRRALYYLTQLQDKPAAVNMSFAGEAFDTSTRKSEIEALVAQLRSAKCVCIASAGNYDTGDVNSPSADAVLYPAACEGVVSVAGLDSTGTERWRVTYDVNKECGSVYNEYVDICAPAENVFTVVNPDLPFKGQSVACGVQYAYQSGTSFSAPQVTAAAALIRRLQPDWSASQVEGALLGNVRAVTAATSGTDDLDNDDINDVQEYGGGALDASAAVLAAVPASGSGSGGSPNTADDAGSARGGERRLYAEQLESQERMTGASDAEIGAALVDAMGANPDVFAWLDVPGTNVSLPLCRRAGDDAYYLTHAASGAEAPFGAAYVESANSADMGDPLTVAYGHTVRGGPQAMFTQLHLLGYAPLFDRIGELHVHLPGRVLDYRVVAAGVVSDEHILDAVGASAAARQAYLDALTDAGLPCNLVRDGARVDAATDRVLQLSTCSNYGYEGRRFVVTAVLVGERTL